MRNDRSRMPALAALATLTAAVAILAAPASGGSPNRATWAVSANLACWDAYVEIRALRKPTTREILIADLGATARIRVRLVHRLSAIVRPRSEVTQINGFLTIARAENVMIVHHVLAALHRGTPDAVNQSVAEALSLEDQYDQMARTLGAHICDDSPAPLG